MSTKPLSSTERNVTIFAILGGLLFLAFMTGKCSLSNFRGATDATQLTGQSALGNQQQTIDQLTYDLEQAQGREDVAQAELTDARDKYDTANAKLKAQIKHNNELQLQLEEMRKLQAENIELRNALTSLRSRQVFVSSVDDLSPQYSKLYSRLRALEGKSADHILESYASINSKLKSNSLGHIKFATGSTTLNDKSLSMIDKISSGTNTGDSYLVIGYASSTGDAAANATLSAKRAEAVADELISKLSGENQVQALYHGETTRFGEDAENQIVEIWKIKK